MGIFQGRLPQASNIHAESQGVLQAKRSVPGRRKSMHQFYNILNEWKNFDVLELGKFRRLEGAKNSANSAQNNKGQICSPPCPISSVAQSWSCLLQRVPASSLPRDPMRRLYRSKTSSVQVRHHKNEPPSGVVYCTQLYRLQRVISEDPSSKGWCRMPGWQAWRAITIPRPEGSWGKE